LKFNVLAHKLLFEFRLKYGTSLHLIFEFKFALSSFTQIFNFFIMKSINDFLVQNSGVKSLSESATNEQKGGRRFVTSSYNAFVAKWSGLNVAGEGHHMCVTVSGGTYCIEW